MDASCGDRQRFDSQAAQLRWLSATQNGLHTTSGWNQWYSQSFILRLDNNYRQFTSTVCSVRSLCEGIAGQSPEALKKGFQRAAYRRILAHEAPDPTNRVRHKLKSLKLTTHIKHPHVRLSARQATPSWIAEEALHNLHLLGGLASARVLSAVFSIVWNRWTTHRRLQRQQTASNRCLLGCSRTAEDSIEHYVNCPFTQELGSRYLRMNRQQINMHTFMMCNPHVATAEDITAAGVLIFAVYMATNHQRHNTPIPTTSIHAALTQWAREEAWATIHRLVS